ncbi:MAG: protein kinase, partial [Polyangiaceae bacterium]
IHRDIKPSNILVEKSGRILLADFGLAKGVRMLDAQGPEPISDPAPGVSGAQVTHAGTIVGTPAYLAPEQASGGLVDHRADIYALGVTLYELLAGQPPFTSQSRMALLEQHRAQEVFSLRMLLPEIRPAVDELVLRMLRKLPDERFATYAALRSALIAARAPPRVDAPFFPRGVAFGIDFMIFGILGAFAGVVSPLLIWPVAATAMGAAEAYFGRTLGKRLMQVRAVDTHGAKLAFGRAVLRSMIKLAGPLMVVITNELTPQGPARKIGTAVALIAWLVSLSLALGGRHLALHDRLTRSRVISALGPSARS